MLLVSSLDVFDCCGLELGGERSHPDPDEEEDGRRDPGVIFSSLLGKPVSPPLPGNTQGQGMGANLACFQEHRQTQPWFWASAPSQTDRKTDDRYRDEDAGSDQEFGEPQDTAVRWGSLSRAARATYPRGTAWKIQEPGQPSPTLTGLWDAQAATARRPGGETRDAGGREQPVRRGVCGRGLLPRPSACSPCQVQPGGLQSSDRWNH